MDYGVPQGSVLGPELYNYNSNDLFLFMVLMVANYADDNSPFTIAPTIPCVINNLETDSENILWWLKYNGLKANPNKFHLLLSETDENLSIKVDKFELSNTTTQKLLGVKDLLGDTSSALRWLDSLNQSLSPETKKKIIFFHI